MYTIVDTIKSLLTECYIAAQRHGFDGEPEQYNPTPADMAYVCDALGFAPTADQWQAAGIVAGGAHVGTFEDQQQALADEHRRFNHDHPIAGCKACEAAQDARPQAIAALNQLADAWDKLNSLWHEHCDSDPINDLLNNGYPSDWASFDEMLGDLLTWRATVCK